MISSERSSNPYYKFELCFGLRCNFRCRYCFQPLSDDELTRTEVTLDQITRYSEYMKYVKAKLDPSYCYTVAAVGGESLLYMDKMLHFAKLVKDDIACFTTVTNGSLIRQKLPHLLEMKKLAPMVFEPIVSYDFCFQNMTRQAGSYQTIRDNIYLLYARGFPTVCISVFDRDTLPRIDEWFDDFLRMLEDVPTLNVKFNLARGYQVFAGLDEEKTRRALEKVKAHLDADPQLRSHFLYNPAFGYRTTTLPHAFVGDIMVGMTLAGGMYPGYDVPFCPESIRNAMSFGHITDDFDDIDARREAVLAETKKHLPSQKCYDCPAVCRVLPWSSMKESMDEYNRVDDETHCYVHKLVSEYINHRRF